MNWDRKLVTDLELGASQEDEDDLTLEARVAALIDQQYDAWPLLRAGVDAFSKIETKRVRVEESEVVVQHNPHRIRSTSASVDKEAVQSRRCFLCPDGLPAEEKGIAYGGDLVILCNPFPVLDRRFPIWALCDYTHSFTFSTIPRIIFSLYLTYIAILINHK